MIQKKKNILFVTTISLVFLVGIIFRILFFSYARPFWNDESAVALNLVNRSYAALFLPLDFSQLTPPLYSVCCKFCSIFISKEEFAFRLPALFCSIASLFVFFALSKKVLVNRCSIVLANVIFALNYQLIYYAQELKQYSCDVFLFLIILLSYFVIPMKTTTKYFHQNLQGLLLFLLSVFYALSMWFSYTALFSLFIIFLTILFANNWSGEIKKLIKIIGFLFFLPLCSFVVLCGSVSRFAQNSELHVFWKNGFISRDFSNLNQLIYDNLLFYFPDFNLKLLIVIFFVLGLLFCLKSLKHSKASGFILVSGLVLAILISYLSIYPLYLRTSLYLFPVCILIIVSAFGFDFFQKRKIGIIFFTVFLFLIIYTLLKTDIEQIMRKHYYRESTANLLSVFKTKSSQKDCLVVPKLSSINYQYYSRNADINSDNVFYIREPLYEYDEIKKVYYTLPAGLIYYVIITHSGDKAYELKNLEKYAFFQKDYSKFVDEFDNALIKFRK